MQRVGHRERVYRANLDQRILGRLSVRFVNDRAIQQFRTVLAMEPNFPRAHMVATAYVQKGQFAEALADVKNWRRVEHGPWVLAQLAYVYGRSGRQAKARQIVEQLRKVYRQRQVDPAPMFVACIAVAELTHVCARTVVNGERSA